MILHFGGYELMRNSCLSLLTSRIANGGQHFNYGFTNLAVYPFLTGLISPFSFLLWLSLTRLLERDGARKTLHKTTIGSMSFVLAVACSLFLVGHCDFGHIVSLSSRQRISQVILALAFLFQNAYQHLLYTQHWSFLSSIVSADEGRKVFGLLNGCSTLFSSFVGAMIPLIVPQTGLLGLMAFTSIFLLGSLGFGEYAYRVSALHPGFDPEADRDIPIDEQEHEDNKNDKRNIDNPNDSTSKDEKKRNNRIAKTYRLFHRVPTLQALLMEVITYQGISTILNVAFARSLQETIIDDVARSSYMGRFYSLINAVSTLIQFVLLPFVLRKAEHSTLWFMTPVLPLSFCAIQAILMTAPGAKTVMASSSLALFSIAFFLTKVMDYAFRTTTYVMVYQPLDYESRFFGSETVNLLGGRLGKSCTSLLLSGMTVIGRAGLQDLMRMATVVGGVWAFSCAWLAKLVPSQAEAERIIHQRTQSSPQQHHQEKQKMELEGL